MCGDEKREHHLDTEERQETKIANKEKFY